MDIKPIFDSHFEQCSETIADFKYNGLSFRGKWQNGDSMSLFLKDLTEAAKHEASQQAIKEVDLDDKIKDLESKLEDALAKA